MKSSTKLFFSCLFWLAILNYASAETGRTIAPKFVGTLDISARYSDLGYWAESDLYLEAPARSFRFLPTSPQHPEGSVTVSTRQLVPTDFDLIETSYEFKELVVSERFEDWVRVEINGDAGWIEMEPGDSFSPYLDLVDGRWGYTLSTQLHVAAEPGGETDLVEITPEMQNLQGLATHWSPHIEIITTKSLSNVPGEDDWIKIQVPDRQPCESYSEAPNLVIEGWIPAYDPDGEITVWYYSRGC